MSDVVAPGVGWGIASLPLFVSGLIKIRRSGLPAVTIALCLLPIELVVLGLLDVYPFLNGRTSYFVLITVAVVCAVGALYLVEASCQFMPLLGILTAVLLTGLFFLNVKSHIGKTPLPSKEDVRAQTEYVVSERHPSDVVLVNSAGNFGVALYWPSQKVDYLASDIVATGFITRVADEDSIVYATNRDERSVHEALISALAVARRRGADHVWVIRSHVIRSERQHWQEAVEQLHLRVEVLDVGPEPLWVIDLQ